MLIGYARTSTVEQVAGLEAQQTALGATGCSKVFSCVQPVVAPRKMPAPATEPPQADLLSQMIRSMGSIRQGSAKPIGSATANGVMKRMHPLHLTLDRSMTIIGMATAQTTSSIHRNLAVWSKPSTSAVKSNKASIKVG